MISGSCRSRVVPQQHRLKKAEHVMTAAKGCLFLETDGAVMDLHMEGHRVAFNK
jgi:hypothetical protein